MKALKNLVTVGLIAGIAATSAFSAPKQKTIKLGFNIPLTGDSPKVGESAKFAGEIIKNEINEAGGLDVQGTKYKLEFIGDSITSGEGTYGALPDTDWLAMYMSSSENYATYTAKALDADYRLISQGGWGVYCGWDNDVRHNIPSCYEKICGLGFGEVNESVGAQKDYDFASWKPDAIVVNLGTNDASAFNQPPFTIPETGETFKQHKNPDGSFVEEDRERFENAVYNFLKMLRKDNPGAHIVWTYGMLGYDLNLLITDAMNRYQKDTGDHNTAFINLPNTTSETVGAHTHPGVKSHERAARVLIEYLQTVLH